jgi:hypothetical protein
MCRWEVAAVLKVKITPCPLLSFSLTVEDEANE